VQPEVAKQENPMLSPDQALDKLKGFLTQNNHCSVLEVSGISPETFKTIHQQIQDDSQQFPGFENAWSVSSWNRDDSNSAQI
jgi:hypothetical protein